MDRFPQVAGNLDLKSLYHYQNFDLRSTDDHVGRLIDILKNQRIWCSNPENFNDPWDCKPYFDPALLDDPCNRAATAEKLISTRRGGPELNHLDERLRNDPQYLKERLHEFSKYFFKSIPSRWGVYCLSQDSRITLMWSHYARDHKGICLEVAVPNTKFCGAFQVHYQEEYPSLLLHDPNTRSRMLLVKSDDWAYEREFRLICTRFTKVENSPLIMDGNYLPIGPEALTSIIMGCQIEDEARTTICNLLKEHAPNVKLRQAMRSLNKYRLTISPGAVQAPRASF